MASGPAHPPSDSQSTTPEGHRDLAIWGIRPVFIKHHSPCCELAIISHFPHNKAHMLKKLYIETVGCQMNVLDSELVVGSLRRQGFQLTEDATDADLILFNTCSVRQHAEDKIYSALGTLRIHKRRHPEKIVGVLGCMAQ